MDTHPKSSTRRRLQVAACAIFLLVTATFYGLELRQGAAPPPPPLPTPPVEAVAPVRATPPPAPPPRTTRTPRPRPQPSTPPPPPPEPEEDEEEEAALASISGTVFDERGRGVGRATVVYQGEGRKRRARTSADGTFDFTSRSPALRIWAERKDGALTARSSPVTLDISEGGEWEVDLVLESTRRAGLGIRVSRHDDGIYVRSVLPGSPAEGLGLMRGDIVIEVDGESVAGLSVSTITNRLTGPEGTQQAFTVRHLDGSVEELQFERRSITPSE